jgi:hypothetical protein
MRFQIPVADSTEENAWNLKFGIWNLESRLQGAAMARNDEPDWVEVAATGQDEEAALIAGLLKSEEIPCEVEGPSGGSPWPENIGAFGLSRIMVPPERAAEARALLERRERDFQRDAPDSEGGEGE